MSKSEPKTMTEQHTVGGEVRVEMDARLLGRTNCGAVSYVNWQADSGSQWSQLSTLGSNT